MTRLPTISVAIPTYGRERVLIETLEAVKRLDDPAEEVVVVDQTVRHLPETQERLAQLSAEGAIRWIRTSPPSIPRAMNIGLREARSDIVLFLDDDIDPDRGLISAHRRCYAEGQVAAMVGMVLQPGETPRRPTPEALRGVGLKRDLAFDFCGTERTPVASVIALNFSVRREAALAVGGFDERFTGAAYRFETEFCRRLRRFGGEVVYEPSGLVRHLRAPSGGTRAYGDHRRTAGPEHSMGDYYFAFLEGRGLESWAYAIGRLVRESTSRYHALHPWWIPAKVIGELRGMLLGWRLSKRASS